MNYQQSSVFYDLLYESKKDYRSETERIKSIVDDELGPEQSRRSLLDVACGTGLHLSYFTHWYNCSGIDISNELLEYARMRVPDCDIQNQDMREIKFDRTFNIVTCLFSAIAHMQTTADLQTAFTSMSQVLASGGIIIVEPGLRKETITPNYTSRDKIETDEYIVRRKCVTKVEDNNYYLEMAYSTESSTHERSKFHEVIKLGLFSTQEYISALTQAGIAVRFDESGLTGRGLLVGTKH